MVSRILTRFDGSKISGCKRFVMIRVFEGGEGSTSGGRSERSSDSCGDLDLEDARERFGVSIPADMMSGKFEELDMLNLWTIEVDERV